MFKSNRTLPADNTMPQLATLWDAQAMLEIFQENLINNKNDTDCEIVSNRLERIRYRPGQRSINLYQLGFKQSNDNRLKHIWVTSSIYTKKSTRRMHRHLKKQFSNELSLSKTNLVPAIYIDQCNALIQSYPYDRYLPQLNQFQDDLPEKVILPIRQSLAKERLKIESYTLVPCRYRPGYAATLECKIRVTTTTGEIASRSYFLKLFRPGLATACYQQILKINTGLETRVPNCQTVEPLCWIEEFDLVILKGANGDSLENLMDQKLDLKKQTTVISRALFQLHTSQIEIDHYKVDSEHLKRNCKAIEFIGWACPETMGILTKIYHHLERCNNDIIRATHCDIKPDHLFINESQVTLIDVDSMAMSDPVYDIAMLLVRINVLPVLTGSSRSYVNQCCQQLLSEYFKIAPLHWQANLPVNLARAALKVSLFFVQHQIDQWDEIVPILLNDTLSTLDVESDLIPGVSL